MLRAFLTVISFFAVCHCCYAQSSDVALWEGVALEYEIADPLSIAFENQLRLNNNISQFRTAFSELGLTYKISSPVRLNAGYRFSLTLKQNRHRFFGGISYRYKVKSIRTSFRTRLKVQHTIVGNERPRDPETYIRPKLQAKYDIKGLPITTFFGAETWFNLTRPDYEFDRYRLQVGLDYEVSKRNTISLIYQHQREFNVTDPLYTHIIAFEISVDITQKKSKKDKKDKEKE